MTAGASSGPDGADGALYRCEADIGGADWVSWRVDNVSRFNGQFGELRTRHDGDHATVRMQPHSGLANVAGNLHGGAIMTFVDIAMFIGARVLGCGSAPGGVTVDLNVQFVGAADLQRPVDAVVEITRETRRLLFLRGTVRQEGDMISSYVGILRKPSQ